MRCLFEPRIRSPRSLRIEAGRQASSQTIGELHCGSAHFTAQDMHSVGAHPGRGRRDRNGRDRVANRVKYGRANTSDLAGGFFNIDGVTSRSNVAQIFRKRADRIDRRRGSPGQRRRLQMQFECVVVPECHQTFASSAAMHRQPVSCSEEGRRARVTRGLSNIELLAFVFDRETDGLTGREVQCPQKGLSKTGKVADAPEGGPDNKSLWADTPMAGCFIKQDKAQRAHRGQQPVGGRSRQICCGGELRKGQAFRIPRDFFKKSQGPDKGLHLTCASCSLCDLHLISSRSHSQSVIPEFAGSEGCDFICRLNIIRKLVRRKSGLVVCPHFEKAQLGAGVGYNKDRRRLQLNEQTRCH